MCKQTGTCNNRPQDIIAMQNYCTKNEPIKNIKETIKTLTGAWRKDLKINTICFHHGQSHNTM